LDSLGPRTKSEKPIMLAEDSQLLEKLILQSLNKAGYTNVLSYANGQEAWDKLTAFKQSGAPIQNNVKLLITDIEMPKMDGHRLLKLIRDDESLKKLPVIIFSSLINREMQLKGEQLGATAQLAKPDIHELVELIDKYILD
jgi:two-component system chemotaxis response regulator CheV